MPEHPLQLRLDPISGRHGAHTLTCDTMHYPVTLDPERNIAFSNLLRRLPAALVGERDPAGELAPQALLRAIGTYLWQALFPDDGPAEQRDTLARALRNDTVPLLLTLPDALAGLPWELLCDPERGDEQGFLARRRPLLRFVPTGASRPAIALPLRVLVLISSPLSLGEDSRVDVESERAAIEQATREAREAGLLHLWIEDFVTPRRVQQAFMQFRPHIVHYIGHGGYDEQAGGILLWEDEQGNELPFPDRRLADLLRPRGLHAVMLHACQTGRRDASNNVLGVAGTLVREGIPAVLAQQGSFTYASSQRASETWYTALTSGMGFADALFEVRQALAQALRPDWAVPILYGSTASLEPLLDGRASPGLPDPALKRMREADRPTPTGNFVGRHRELRALRLLLESPPGSGPVLAFITGPGGIGKSTLAAQAVSRYGSRYKAVLTLSCLGYQNVELFLQRLGEWLKRQDAPGLLEVILPDAKLSVSAKIEAAIEALNQAGPVLLIVDNLESVQQDDQRLRDPDLLLLLQKLLTNLQGGRVLLTGRYAVQGLLPDGRFAAHLLHLDLDDLSRYETAQLLTSHDKLAGLGEITRQTLIQEFGGLPYVYDLLSNDAMVQSLDRLLSDIQGRITQERQQRSAQEWQMIRRQVVEFAALEATVARLSVPSRQLLARLSVLELPYPLSAIEQGLGAERSAWQPLLERSLLRYDEQQKSYRLHSLTRHYAGSLLDEQEGVQAQSHLATWYEHYADRESHDLADYLQAHHLYRAAGALQPAGELVMALAEPLRRFGLYILLRDLCTMTMNDLKQHDEELTALTLHELGNIAYLQGDYAEARRLYQQSLEIKERLGNQGGKAGSLHQLGMIAQDQGDYAEARRLYQQSLETFERLGDQSGKATTLHELGNIAYLQGDYAEARRLYQQSLEIKERLGDQGGKANSLHQLGMIAQDQGDYAEARRLYQQSLEIKERLGDQNGKANSLGQLGVIAFEQDDLEQALVLTIQAFFLLDALHAPARAIALRMLARIRTRMDEDTFIRHWRALAGERPVPDLPQVDAQHRSRRPSSILSRLRPGRRRSGS
jgi:tetratricopeptide (TPR) repeat protein